jgi:hypothetical protein
VADVFWDSRLNRWKSRGLRDLARFTHRAYVTDDRHDAFRVVAETIAGATDPRPWLYLEFGVSTGRTFRWWADALPKSARMVGFDTFEGLPYAWREIPAGSFTAHGETPAGVTNENATFVKGLIGDTLPGWVRTNHDLLESHRLLVHVDVDLYEPTRDILRELAPYLTPGTITMFDELFDPAHEYRALKEFSRQSGRRYTYLVLPHHCLRAAIQWK